MKLSLVKFGCHCCVVLIKLIIIWIGYDIPITVVDLLGSENSDKSHMNKQVQNVCLIEQNRCIETMSGSDRAKCRSVK